VSEPKSFFGSVGRPIGEASLYSFPCLRGEKNANLGERHRVVLLYEDTTSKGTTSKGSKGKLEALAWTAAIVGLAVLGTLALYKVGLLAHMGTYSPYVTYGALGGAGALTLAALIRLVVKSCQTLSTTLHQKSLDSSDEEQFYFGAHGERIPTDFS